MTVSDLPKTTFDSCTASSTCTGVTWVAATGRYYGSTASAMQDNALGSVAWLRGCGMPGHRWGAGSAEGCVPVARRGATSVCREAFLGGQRRGACECASDGPDWG